jgi:hypothetical protein
MRLRYIVDTCSPNEKSPDSVRSRRRKKRKRFLHEPTNEHAAPTELENDQRGVGGYRHGAPTELLKPVHAPNACAKAKQNSP